MKDVAAIVQEQAQQLKRKLCHEGEDDEEEHDDSNDDSKGDSNNNGSEDENSTNDDNEAMRMHVRWMNEAPHSKNTKQIAAPRINKNGGCKTNLHYRIRTG